MKKKEKLDVKIFSINDGSKPRYIGKTRVFNKKGEIGKSLPQFYANEGVRKIKFSENFNIKEIETVQTDDWFDSKLKHIVDYHRNKHADLLNAQHFLEGKRGYWQGKLRDDHTIKRLAESKYKRIVEYNLNGQLVKIWNSIKDASINAIGDYHVVNGSAKSRLYSVVKNKNPKKHLENNSYWFKEIDVLKHFSVIPKKINIDILYTNYKRAYLQHKKISNHLPSRDKAFKPILKINKTTNETIKLYKSLLEAGSDNNIHPSTVSAIARNIKNCTEFTYCFALTKHREKYNLHDPKNINAIVQVDDDGNVVGRFKTSNHAAESINGKATTIRRCARGKQDILRHRGFYWYYEPKL